MKVLLLILAAFVSVASAQSTQPCSQFSIESVEKVDPGEAVVFLAKMSDTSLREVKYRWTISAGTVTSGQDTSSIAVDTTGLGGQLLEATVEVAGRDWRCSVKSKGVEIAPPPIACGIAFDDYGDIRFEDEKARLDNFAIQLLNIPDARASIMIYAGNPTYRAEAQYRLQRAKNYLVKTRGIDPARLILTDGGYRSNVETILHVVPKDVTPPSPDPEGAVPLSEVRFTKRPPSQLRRGTKPRR
jgi:hypothetical protein